VWLGKGEYAHTRDFIRKVTRWWIAENAWPGARFLERRSGGAGGIRLTEGEVIFRGLGDFGGFSGVGGCLGEIFAVRIFGG